MHASLGLKKKFLAASVRALSMRHAGFMAWTALPTTGERACPGTYACCKVHQRMPAATHLVGIQGVDDDVHEPVDLGLEGELLGALLWREHLCLLPAQSNNPFHTSNGLHVCQAQQQEFENAI